MDGAERHTPRKNINHRLCNTLFTISLLKLMEFNQSSYKRDQHAMKKKKKIVCVIFYFSLPEFGILVTYFNVLSYHFLNVFLLFPLLKH